LEFLCGKHVAKNRRVIDTNDLGAVGSNNEQVEAPKSPDKRGPAIGSKAFYFPRYKTEFS
jgi:hypothetical protein